MEEEFVADSEGEGGLELSPPGYGHPMPLDASFDHFQAQIGQPGQAIYSPSTISEFPSTLQTTAKQPFDSPIVDFTATTHSSIDRKTSSNKKPKATTTEILDLSSEEEIYVAPKPRKPPRQKAASPSESAYGEPAKPPAKSRKQSDAHEGDIPPAKDKAKKPKKKPARANSEDEILSLNESENAMPTRKVPKKRKSQAKKKLGDDEAIETEAPKVPSKKRKSPGNDDLPVGKPSKKRKKNSPQIDDVESKAEDHTGKKAQRGRRLLQVSDEESADELLLTKDTPVEAKKFKSSTPRPTRKSEIIPPDDNGAIVSAEDSSVPSPQVQQAKSESPPPPSESSTSMLPPPPPQPAKAAPRLSTETRPTYAIPKRGSISDLLRKTGLHTPLSSSKLTRKAGDRIAPLHATRTTPPPPPPPIPKPKKKVVDVDEDEDDFTGMTEKQIAKFLEEKKKKAWYSP